MKRGDFTFDTRNFELKKGETTTVKVELIAGTLKVVEGDSVIEQHDLPRPTPFAVANFALNFAGGNYVSVPSFKGIESEQWCIEAQLNCTRPEGNAIVKGHGSLGVLYWNVNWSGGVPVAQSEVIGVGGRGERIAHVALVRDGAKLSIFVNGKLGETKEAKSFDSFHRDAPMFIGNDEQRSELNAFHDTIDELRISKVTRYDSDFVAPSPTDRFSPDADTLALYHFDEGQGDVLRDSSGNNHHGKIIGARWIKAE